MNDVAIIFPNDNWILQRMGEQLLARIPNAKKFYHDDPVLWIKDGPLDRFGQINYFINYAVFKRPTTGIDVALFTHPEPQGFFADLFWKTAAQVDMPVCMTKKYVDELWDRGIASTYIIPGIDPQFGPKLHLAFIGRYNDQNTARKGADLIQRLSCLPYVEIFATQGQLSADQLPSVYQYADYTIVTSRYEGGPMCLLESLACGRKVIIPYDVGLAGHFLDHIIPYEAGNYESLKAVIDTLYAEKLRLAEAVAPYTWDSWSEAHIKLFDKLQGLANSIAGHGKKSLHHLLVDKSQLLLDKIVPLPKINRYAAEKKMNEINLHLGCGGFYLDGWINIDNYDFDPMDSSRSGANYDIKMDIRKLEAQPNSIGKILLVHVLEHFVRWEAIELLKQFYRLLKPGGSLIMEHPDFDQCIYFYQHRKETIQTPLGHLNIGFTQFYGNQWDHIDYETHRYVWTQDELGDVLAQIGFESIKMTNETQFHVPERDMAVIAKKPILSGKSRRVVYTALFGDYEALNEQPCPNREGIDFICLTDSSDLRSSSWKVVKVNNTGLDSTRESRRPKLLAHDYFGTDYDESLYIDNSVILKCDPADIFTEFLPKGVDFCCFPHPWRNCLYQEAVVVKREQLDDPHLVDHQINYYQSLGYPANNGLIAGGFLLRRHNVISVVKTMNLWFEQVLNYSKRDQISFNFAAWFCHFEFVTLNLNLTDNPLMQWPIHNQRKTRLHDKNEPIIVTGEAYIWQSLGGDAGRREEFYIDNPRLEIISQFDHPPRRVLEIGCATGATGKLIKDSFPNAWVAGIELSATAAKIAASRLDVVINQKFEESSLEVHGITQSSIDTVILADVLEHMYDPWHVLVRLRPYLTPDAQVVASIPNIRNWWLMNELVAGRFTYETLGLLDITHIRFFTRYEINKLFRETGYEITKTHYLLDTRLAQLQCQPGSSSIVTDKLILNTVSPEDLLELKTLQFVVLARPIAQFGQNKAPIQQASLGQYPIPEIPLHEQAMSEWLERHRWSKAAVARLSANINQFDASAKVHFLLIDETGISQSLSDTLSSLVNQSLASWKVTVFSPAACPSTLPGILPLTWVNLNSATLSKSISNAVTHSDADWFFLGKPLFLIEPVFSTLIHIMVARHPDWRFIYFDEDQIDTGGRFSKPLLKPDANLDLLRSTCYIGYACLIHCDLWKEINCEVINLGLVFNYMAALRCYEVFGEKAVGHIDEILLHHAPSSDGELQKFEELAKPILQEHLYGQGIFAEVGLGLVKGSFFVDYPLPYNPLVSIIIPTKDRLDLLQPCIESCLEKTQYPNYEIIIVDNLSSDPATLDYLAELPKRDQRIRVIPYPYEYNYSTINNLAARQARGEFLLLLNNDTMVLQENWLARMVSIGLREDVGVTGCRLVYLNQRIQHAGVVIGMSSSANHVGIDSPMDDTGYMGRLQLTQNFLAVTAACMLVKRKLFFAVEGLDEIYFPILFNDVDLCLKIAERGYRIVWTPYVTLVHHASVSLKSEADAADNKKKQIYAEKNLKSHWALVKKWVASRPSDPAYHRYLSLRESSWVIDGNFDVPWHPDLETLPRVVAQPPDEMGVGQYRMIAPLKELTDNERICSFLLPPLSSEKRFLPYVSELVRAKPTVFFLQNAFTNFHIDDLRCYAEVLPNLFRVFGQDDIVFSVPAKSAVRKYFGKDTKARVRKAVSLCHRAIVTTESIAEAMRGMVDDIRVVPNYLQRSYWGDLQQPPRNERHKFRVGWAGAQQHQGDLELILPVVEATANEVDWVFMGMCPPKLRYHVTEVHNAVPFNEYPAALAALDLDLAIAPLEINRFNTAKSNLRLLEYGAAGYPVIATDILPYRNAPVARVPNNPKAWIDAIRAHVHDRDATRAAGEQLREWVLSNWMLDQHLDEWMKALLPD